MKKFDLTWGESVCVRQRFVENLKKNAPTIFGLKELQGMGYTKHEGDIRLIEVTREVIYRQTGLKPAYVLLTNGATGGVTIALRAYAQLGCKYAITLNPPNFPLYPSMIKASGLKRKFEGEILNDPREAVVLLDSPSNPLGLIFPPTAEVARTWLPVVWDAVYHNNVYSNWRYDAPKHDIMVGSYSKLTGLNGIRIGWIATDNLPLYEIMKDLVTAEYAGLSQPSNYVLLDRLEGYYWEEFEQAARCWLNYNREEWAKLERYFGGRPVKDVGMFYYSNMDEACKKLMEKSGVEWMTGSQLGTTDDYGRFNLGQDLKVIKEAVKSVLKNDKS